MQGTPHPEVAQYALEASLRSASHAESSAASLMDKASSLLTVVLALFAVASGATSVALRTRHDPSWLQWSSFGFFCVVDAALVLAALNAFLATVPMQSIGLNLHRFKQYRAGHLETVVGEEAVVWHRGALLAMARGTRQGNDLLAARRWLLVAVVAGMPGTILTSIRLV
ncbi:MAG TPA: hypothetical protein VFC09_04020 [Candidatus Dormibacteraeota bacterium]|nr:hypothetical protein [Candidatus Dormibacteraeota bacterium]